MSRPILVGYDPKTSDRAPVRFGVQAARLTGAPLVIASVVVELPAIGVLGGPPDEAPCETAGEVLRQIREELEADGLAVECRELRALSAPRGLHEAAEEADAALLVVGSTRRGTVGRLLPGSVAERLMHGAPCPVGVVPNDWETRGGLRTIAVAYVDTPEGGEALRGAYALARRTGATLRVLTVIKPGLGMYAETSAYTASHPAERAHDLDAVEGEHRVEAEEQLRRKVAELGGDVTVEVDAFVGDPADVLVEMSANVDLLVCGSRGYGPTRSVLLGGVSRRVASESRCPVIVLPRGVKAPLDALVGRATATSPSG
jgi:nucleotide-binding universal stress UspA family protein